MEAKDNAAPRTTNGLHMAHVRVLNNSLIVKLRGLKEELRLWPSYHKALGILSLNDEPAPEGLAKTLSAKKGGRWSLQDSLEVDELPDTPEHVTVARQDDDGGFTLLVPSAILRMVDEALPQR